MPVTNYTWDVVSDSVLEETDGAGAVQVGYTNEPSAYGPLVSEKRGAQSSQYHFDALGSTRALTNDAQTVTDMLTYDAWGNKIYHTGSSQTPWTWNGESGYRAASDRAVYHIRRRDYSPFHASFSAADPVFFSASLNRYFYARNSPAALFDPSGLLWEQQGSSSIWKATADGDDLITLAMMVSTVERDWVCIWPVPDRILWSDYPTAKECAKADVRNLIADDKKEFWMAARSIRGADGFLTGTAAIIGDLPSWQNGNQAATMFKTQSNEGGSPLSLLVMVGHGDGSERLANFTLTNPFEAKDVFTVATENNNATNTYKSAIKRIGPPRCWLQSRGRVYGVGCLTAEEWAPDWKSKIARPGATVFGSPVLMESWSAGPNRGIWFVNPNAAAVVRARNRQQLLALAGWVSSPGGA